MDVLKSESALTDKPTVRERLWGLLAVVVIALVHVLTAPFLKDRE